MDEKLETALIAVAANRPITEHL